MCVCVCVCVCACVFTCVRACLCVCVHAAVLTEGRTGLHGVRGASPLQSHSVRGEQNPQNHAAFINLTNLKGHIFMLSKMHVTLQSLAEIPRGSYLYIIGVNLTTCYTLRK